MVLHCTVCALEACCLRTALRYCLCVCFEFLVSHLHSTGIAFDDETTAFTLRLLALYKHTKVLTFYFFKCHIHHQSCVENCA